MDERRILIVEDEQKIADTLKLGLTEQGYGVEVAYDGLIGWKMMQNQSFDIVILDINLPGMNGYDVLEALRNQPVMQDVPVIVISALTEIDSVARCKGGSESCGGVPFGGTLLRSAPLPATV